MNLKQISRNLQNDIEKLGYHLFDLKYNKQENILSVIIDESFDLDKIEELSRKVSKLMDKYDESFDNYILDVCSVGVERPLRTLDEIKSNIGEFVYVKTSTKNITGTIKKVKDSIISLEYKDKNIKKMVDVNYKDIKKIHKTVKV